MENGPFEDVFPIKDGDIPASYVSLPEGNCNSCFPGVHLALGSLRRTGELFWLEAVDVGNWWLWEFPNLIVVPLFRPVLPGHHLYGFPEFSSKNPVSSFWCFLKLWWALGMEKSDRVLADASFPDLYDQLKPRQLEGWRDGGTEVFLLHFVRLRFDFAFFFEIAQDGWNLRLKYEFTTNTKKVEVFFLHFFLGRKQKRQEMSWIFKVFCCTLRMSFQSLVGIFNSHVECCENKTQFSWVHKYQQKSVLCWSHLARSRFYNNFFCKDAWDGITFGGTFAGWGHQCFPKQDQKRQCFVGFCLFLLECQGWRKCSIGWWWRDLIQIVSWWHLRNNFSELSKPNGMHQGTKDLWWKNHWKEQRKAWRQRTKMTAAAGDEIFSMFELLPIFSQQKQSEPLWRLRWKQKKQAGFDIERCSTSIVESKTRNYWDISRWC